MPGCAETITRSVLARGEGREKMALPYLVLMHLRSGKGGSDGGKRKTGRSLSSSCPQTDLSLRRHAEGRAAKRSTMPDNHQEALLASLSRSRPAEKALVIPCSYFFPRLSYTRSHVIHCTCCSARTDSRTTAQADVFEERLIALNDLLPHACCSVVAAGEKGKGKDCRTTQGRGLPFWPHKARVV